MSLSKKYGRTFHYPFSPGTTSDDRIYFDYWMDVKALEKVVHTEKLDGENTCLNQYGVFARSHVEPTRHPWANYLKERWESLKNDLGNIEIFGENLYAIHSIEYHELEEHFHVFAIRYLDKWLDWEEVKFYAAMLGFSTVPEIELVQISTTNRMDFQTNILKIVEQKSAFNSVDVQTQLSCQMEGIVSRNAGAFGIEKMQNNVFKYVRKDHVKTDEHWMGNWKRAPFKWEKSCGK